MQSRPLLPCMFRLLHISAPLWLAPFARSLVLSHTISTGIHQYFTVVEGEECDLPSSKHSRLDKGDHDNSDGSSITAEEDMDEQESTAMTMTAASWHLRNNYIVQTMLPPHCKSWAEPCYSFYWLADPGDQAVWLLHMPLSMQISLTPLSSHTQLTFASSSPYPRRPFPRSFTSVLGLLLLKNNEKMVGGIISIVFHWSYHTNSNCSQPHRSTGCFTIVQTLCWSLNPRNRLITT